MAAKASPPQSGTSIWIAESPKLPHRPKKPTSMRLDVDLMSWFKNHHEPVAHHVNRVLRAYVDAASASAKGKD